MKIPVIGGFPRFKLEKQISRIQNFEKNKIFQFFLP